MTDLGTCTRQIGTFLVNLENIRVFAGGFGPTGRGANMHREAGSPSIHFDVESCMLAVRGAPFYTKSGFPEDLSKTSHLRMRCTRTIQRKYLG
jgi:hypothetical protein